MIAQRKIDINNLRVAKPCPTSWESMTGDERTRHCDLCSLNVYNISAMTEKEAQKLISEREGRLCIRFYRRADGTVITKDCPVGLRAVQKRVTRFAGATLAAVLGLFSISYGQEKESDKVKTPEVVREKTKGTSQKIELSGTVLDINGAVIPGVRIQFIRGEDKKVLSTTTDGNGDFSFKDFPQGVYELETESVLGFAKLSYKSLDINGSEKIKITLSASAGMQLVGDLVEYDPSVDIDSRPSPMTLEILPRKLEKIPTK